MSLEQFEILKQYPGGKTQLANRKASLRSQGLNWIDKSGAAGG
jgi:hypothetical protein